MTGQVIGEALVALSLQPRIARQPVHACSSEPWQIVIIIIIIIIIIEFVCVIAHFSGATCTRMSPRAGSGTTGVSRLIIACWK
jgi:hypothetical protein